MTTPRTYRIRGNTKTGYVVACPHRSSSRVRIRLLSQAECDLLAVPQGSTVYIPAGFAAGDAQ